MAISSTVAKQLCTKTELVLFTESLARNVTVLGESAIRARVVRSRRLRDKYRQLGNRQDREARGKQQPRRQHASKGSAATRKKEQLFDESLTRYERQLDKLEQSRRSPAKKNVARAKPAKKIAKKVVAKKRTATARKKVSESKSALKKKATRKTAPVKKSPVKKSPVKKKAAKTTTDASGSTSRVESARKPTARKKATVKAKRERVVASGQTRKRTHRTAENRRQQARRDSR